MYVIELWHPGGDCTYVKYSRKGAISIVKLADATNFATMDEASEVASRIDAPIIPRVVSLIPHPPSGCNESEGES